MSFHPLYSDWFLYFLIFLVIITFVTQYKKILFRQTWHLIVASRSGMFSLVILILFLAVALCDSIHLRIPAAQRHNGEPALQSLLDKLAPRLAFHHEVTYSSPLSNQHSVASHYERADGTATFGRAPLKHIASSQNHPQMVWLTVGTGLLIGLGITAILIALIITLRALLTRQSWRQTIKGFSPKKTDTAWTTLFITLLCVITLVSIALACATQAHLFGTNRIGHDVFYESLKSIRTGVLIGTLSTLFMLPFALILGMVSGYYRGWVDDVIQFIYTTLSSIPGVLLISATILVMQLYIQNHTNIFSTYADRADARLIALCLVLGLTGWANLCRLLRAETLKIKSYDYVQVATVMKISKPRILWRHILPNVFHLVIITIALDFSGLVLAEAVLSYVGVGVDPTTPSWGNMINAARLEMARDPAVWWALAAAMSMMFLLVLAANLFADTVRDALDPRTRSSTASDTSVEELA